MKISKILLLLCAVILTSLALYFYTHEKSLHVLIEFIKNPTHTGFIAPSSSFLAHELATFMADHKEPIKILEVGAGTGKITDIIVSKLKPTDSLDILEINEEFCAFLKKKFSGYENIKFHCTSILDWHPGYTYDIIISTLPLNNFKAEMAEQMMHKCISLTSPGGCLSYIDYIGADFFKKLVLNKQEYAAFTATRKTLEKLRTPRLLETVSVWINLPPTYVHHLQMPK